MIVNRLRSTRFGSRPGTVHEEKTVRAAGRSRSLWFLKNIPKCALTLRRSRSRNWNKSKASVLNTLASVHSRRSYAFAIDRFIAWYCSEPRLTFNRAVVPFQPDNSRATPSAGARLVSRLWQDYGGPPIVPGQSLAPDSCSFVRA
jgi:hypothetical protein